MQTTKQLIDGWVLYEISKFSGFDWRFLLLNKAIYSSIIESLTTDLKKNSMAKFSRYLGTSNLFPIKGWHWKYIQFVHFENVTSQDIFNNIYEFKNMTRLYIGKLQGEFECADPSISIQELTWRENLARDVHTPMNFPNLQSFANLKTCILNVQLYEFSKSEPIDIPRLILKVENSSPNLSGYFNAFHNVQSLSVTTLTAKYSYECNLAELQHLLKNVKIFMLLHSTKLKNNYMLSVAHNLRAVSMPMIPIAGPLNCQKVLLVSCEDNFYETPAFQSFHNAEIILLYTYLPQYMHHKTHYNLKSAVAIYYVEVEKQHKKSNMMNVFCPLNGDQNLIEKWDSMETIDFMHFLENKTNFEHCSFRRLSA